MKSVEHQLRTMIDDARPRLLRLGEAGASAKPFPDKWSLKEILGHCVDSAHNNLQRVVRMQEVPNIGSFQYSQAHWVDAQNYLAEPWDELVNVWYYANRHLAHTIGNIKPATLGNVVDMGNPKPATLQYVAEDYLRHLRHHLDQIFSEADPRERTKWKSGQ